MFMVNNASVGHNNHIALSLAQNHGRMWNAYARADGTQCRSSNYLDIPLYSWFEWQRKIFALSWWTLKISLLSIVPCHPMLLFVFKEQLPCTMASLSPATNRILFCTNKYEKDAVIKSNFILKVRVRRNRQKKKPSASKTELVQWAELYAFV